MRTLPKYATTRPYDITSVIRQNTKDIDAIQRRSRGSEEYTYSVTWTGTTTAGSVGNGSLLGFYRRLGTAVLFRIDLRWGSTTAAPTGVWYFTLPVPPDCSQADYVGTSLAVDAT